MNLFWTRYSRFILSRVGPDTFLAGYRISGLRPYILLTLDIRQITGYPAVKISKISAKPDILPIPNFKYLKILSQRMWHCYKCAVSKLFYQFVIIFWDVRQFIINCLFLKIPIKTKYLFDLPSRYRMHSRLEKRCIWSHTIDTWSHPAAAVTSICTAHRGANVKR